MEYRHEPVPVVKGPPVPPALLARSRELLEATLDLVPPIGISEAVKTQIMPRFPVHSERAKHLASEVGVSASDLFTANLCYDIIGSESLGCSTLALPGPDGPVLARNMDWFPEEKIARASCLVHEEFGINAGFLGLIGVVTGLSNRGFALALNAGYFEPDLAGYPMLLFLRHVMDTAGSFGEALEMIRTGKLMSGGIITLVGVSNDERVIIERSPSRAVLRTAKADEPLIATNHFRALAPPGYFCTRYAFLADNMDGRSAMDLLTSDEVLQGITAQHVIARPSRGTIEMSVPSHLLEKDYRPSHGPGDVFGMLGL